MLIPNVSIILSAAMAATSPASERVALHETPTPGDTATVRVEFQMRGDIVVSPSAKPLKLAAKGQIAFEEKVLPVAADSKDVTARSLRYYTAAAVDSVVEEQRTTRQLRDALRVMVGEVRGGRPFLFSPSGPLTIPERELVEEQLDSLIIGGLLPAQPVTVGDTWKPANGTLAAIFGLFDVAKNDMEAKLTALDDKTAQIDWQGTVDGDRYGARTTVRVSGQIVFDRTRSKITRVTLNQTDDQSAGPIKPGFKGELTLTLERDLESPVPHLAEEAVAKLPVDPNPATELLVYQQAESRFQFYVPRGWHIFQENPRVAVLQLFENGDLLARCNVLAAQTVAAGTHMKPEEFREQVKQALGKQFERFLQEGEVPAPKGHWIYRLAAVGAFGDRPAAWYYYLVASPQGEQLVFIFSLDARSIDQFEAKDLAIVGSIEFGAARTASTRTEP